MTDRAFNALAIAATSAALFSSFLLPFIIDAPEHAEEVPQKAVIHPVLPFVEVPDVSYALLNKAKDDAYSCLSDAMALIETSTSVKPLRHFEPYTLEYVGKFYLTMYAATVEQCGNDLGITASGRKCTEDPTCWTVAVDPSVIPLGTYLKIDLEGYEDIIFRADDTGGDIKNYWIDIYTDSEPLSKTFNPTYAEVWIVDYV